MRINKSIKEYIIFSGSTILEALNKINANKSRIVFVLQDNGVLLGSVSDGDIRRWITSNNNLNLDEFIDKVMNEKVVSRPISESILNIKKSYENKFDIIPLVDDQGRFVAVAKRDGRDFQIRDFSIGKDKPTFIIGGVFIAIYLIFYLAQNIIFSNDYLLVILISSLAIFLIGIYDDKYNLSANKKLFFNF